MIYDKNIQWKRKRIYLPATSFCGGATGAGAPALTAIGALGIVGHLLVDAGDDVRHFWAMPYDVDVTKSIGFRVWWHSEAAAVGDRDIDLKVLYLPITPGVTALITPATALDTVIPLAQVPTGTANVIERTSRGEIAADTIANTVSAMALLVEMDAFDAAFTEVKTFLGLEIDYAVRRTHLQLGPAMTAGVNNEYFGTRQTEQQYVEDLSETVTAIE